MVGCELGASAELRHLAFVAAEVLRLELDVVRVRRRIDLGIWSGHTGAGRRRLEGSRLHLLARRHDSHAVLGARLVLQWIVRGAGRRLVALNEHAGAERLGRVLQSLEPEIALADVAKAALTALIALLEGLLRVVGDLAVDVRVVDARVEGTRHGPARSYSLSRLERLASFDFDAECSGALLGADVVRLRRVCVRLETIALFGDLGIVRSRAGCDLAQFSLGERLHTVEVFCHALRWGQSLRHNPCEARGGRGR